MAVGAGIDFSRWSLQRATLKEVSDLLATRGAREFLLANATETNIKAVIDAAVANNVGASYDLGTFSHIVEVDTADATVTVRLVQPPKSGLILTKFFPYSEDIEMRSTAVARGGTNVCVILLEAFDSGALYADEFAQLTATDCALMSNSVDPTGVDVSGGAKMTADVICSAGGYAGALANYEPMPTTDCPSYADPLSERMAPSIGTCDYTDMEIGDPKQKLSKALENTITALIATKDGQRPGTLPGYTRYDLTPGVYCGGLAIVEQAVDVHFAPGIYIIKDGNFHVERGARIYGKGVGFYLDGKSSTFTFEKSSIISLTAPETGPMAGLLFWEGNSVNPGKTHKIKSANARELLGTIYLKKGTLLIDSTLPIADASAYTAIVANRLEMSGSPTLRLNADYAATEVPVPAGVGPVGGGTYLRE